MTFANGGAIILPSADPLFLERLIQGERPLPRLAFGKSSDTRGQGKRAVFCLDRRRPRGCPGRGGSNFQRVKELAFKKKRLGEKNRAEWEPKGIAWRKENPAWRNKTGVTGVFQCGVFCAWH